MLLLRKTNFVISNLDLIDFKFSATCGSVGMMLEALVCPLTQEAVQLVHQSLLQKPVSIPIQKHRWDACLNHGLA